VGAGEGEGDSRSRGRDATYSLFHALGKVLHHKREVAPEAIVERADAEPARFVEFLHENALAAEAREDDVAALAHAFSDADLLDRAAHARFGNVRRPRVALCLSRPSSSPPHPRLPAQSQSAVSEELCASVAARSFLVLARPASSAGRITPLRGPGSAAAARLAADLRVAATRCCVRLPRAWALGSPLLPPSDLLLEWLPLLHEMRHRGGVLSPSQAAVATQLGAFSARAAPPFRAAERRAHVQRQLEIACAAEAELAMAAEEGEARRVPERIEDSDEDAAAVGGEARPQARPRG
jgi:hypothetical protein